MINNVNAELALEQFVRANPALCWGTVGALFGLCLLVSGLERCMSRRSDKVSSSLFAEDKDKEGVNQQHEALLPTSPTINSAMRQSS